jgi:arylsulfatase A-like enzyme
MVLAGWHMGPQVITEKVQVADLAPTLAKLTGVHWPSSEVLDGKSRLDLFSGKNFRAQKSTRRKHH